MIQVGIDVGFSSGRIGIVNDYGIPAMLPDLRDPNQFDTPSWVWLGPHGVVVGQIDADSAQTGDATALIRLPKAQLGDSNPSFIDGRKQAWTPDMILALILCKLRRDAEAYLSDRISRTFLTVPPDFSDQQRLAVNEAAQMADMGEIVLVDEPIAIASHYGLHFSRRDQILLVFHAGAVGTSVSVLNASPAGIVIRKSRSSSEMSGAKIDDLLANAIIQNLPRSVAETVRANPESLLRMQRIAESVKTSFTQDSVSNVRRSALLRGIPIDVNMNSLQFSAMIEPIISSSVDLCAKCLADASVGWRDVDQVLISGAASQLPGLQRRLLKVSELPPDRFACRSPQYACIFGAIAMTRKQSAGGATTASSGAANAGLGIRVMNPRTGKPDVKVLIPCGSKFPVEVTDTFYTTRADQTRLVLNLVQVSSDGQEHDLGPVSFGPILRPRKNYTIEVVLGYDAEGMVILRARDPVTREEIAHSAAGSSTQQARDFQSRQRIVRMTSAIE